MKPLNYCLSVLVLLFIAVAVQAQTADEIINKHLEAIGGKAKLSGINSVRMESSVDIGGNNSPSWTVILNGKGYRNEGDFDGQKVIQVYTDKSGWVVNAFMGITDPQPMPDQQFKDNINLIYVVPLLDYAARGDKAELVGQEKLGNVNAYKIKLTNKNNSVSTYYIDPATYYIVQAVSTVDFGGQPAELKTTFSEYKATDYGWVVPYNVLLDFGGQFSMVSKVNKVELNNTVDATIFEMKK